MRNYFPHVISASLCLCLIFVVLLGSFQCSSDSKGIWEGKKKIVLQKQLTIGTDDMTREETVFGNVRHFAIDSNGSIYVSDKGLFRIQKFSPYGRFLRSFGMGEGYNPGEFIDLRGITLDAKKNLYTTDFRGHRITKFDSTGAVIDTVLVGNRPYRVAIGNDGSLYVLGSPLEGQMIPKYNPDGSFDRFFYKIDDQKGFKSGTYGDIAIDSEGNIYYALPYPYEIQKYSPDGTLMDRFTRTVSFYSPPYLKKIGSATAVILEGSTVGLAILPDGTILHLIYRTNDYLQFEYHLDLFSEDGTFLLTTPLADFGIEQVGAIQSDQQGNVYFLELAPHLKIVKYSMSIENTNLSAN